jgi:hypothetical protein
MSTSSKASGSQKAKVADSTSIESYPELVNFDICALRQQIIGPSMHLQLNWPKLMISQ